jgi:putative DNA primase/helicase
LVGRFIVLQLTEGFYGREDPGLTGALMAELPGILSWALEGYRRIRHRGHFVQPASAVEAVADLKVLAAPIKGFAPWKSSRKGLAHLH